jgi:TP901 family phage tail tape measure protein
VSNKLEYFFKFSSDGDRLQATIDKIDKKLGGVDSKAKRFGATFTKSLDKINKKLGAMHLHSFIQNVQSASQGLQALNAPAIKLDASMKDLGAIVDLTDKQLNNIEKSARKNAKVFGVDAADGVESYKLILSQLSPELAKQPKALAAMGNSVAVLSKTMSNDQKAATGVLTAAMNQYKVSLDDPIKASGEMSRMMNIMAAAAKEGSAELPEQKAALEQSGMAAKAAKLEFQEHAAAIQVLDKAGKKGSEGGVALRNTLATLAQGRFIPKQVRDELQGAGVDITKLTDTSKSFTDRLRPLKAILKDQALLTKLFGKENSNAALALISSVDEQDRLKAAIVGTNTAREQANIVMESQAEKNARLKSRIDDFKISLFNATGGVLGYAEVLGGLAFDISNLIPLFSGAGKMISFMTNAQKLQALWTNITAAATWGWSTAQWALNAAMTPIFIIPAIIIAVGAAIAWVISKTDGWGKAWTNTVDGAKFLFKAFVSSAKFQFLAVVNGIMIGINKIKKGWHQFKKAVGIGDGSENDALISKIDQDTAKRKKAIIDAAKEVAKNTKAALGKFGAAGKAIKWKVTPEVAEPKGSLQSILAGGSGSSNNNAGGNTGSSGLKKTNASIATGGNKTKQITINLSSLIETLKIEGNSFKETATQMETSTTDALLRVLASAAAAN